MTRPHIIRADTLDLQDKTSPTAQDHSQQPEHPAPLGIGPAAPHQQAAIRHVEQERTSEEARLQNAWGNAGTALGPDPGSDDERTTVKASAGAEAGDADMQDADVDDDDDDDMDDDMMDKISSSPSIDDGGYSLPSPLPARPTRGGSLTPRSSPLNSATASSSPFTNTPVHFPLSLANARDSAWVPSCERSPLSKHSIHSSPSLSPSPNPKSMEHHQGEYAWTRIAGSPANSPVREGKVGASPRAQHLDMVQRRLALLREDSSASMLSELDSEYMSHMLQPLRSTTVGRADDPFLDTAARVPRTCSGTPPPIVGYPDDDDDDEDDGYASDDSWTTDSDVDSWEDRSHRDDDDDNDNDDASNNAFFSTDSRFIDSGWGGECLRETEDIDFEFVYALHTFVATVEGQANATKGDTMVLLDDSNSYWWLVRVVKDSSIGYLPAEHIETPTERLARLNKHRNIDLSATMLGDTAEKSKNPLKKAMRRRNAKTVQFAPPTYVEASDYDYSSDEGDGELFGGPAPKQMQQQQQEQQASQQSASDQDEGLQVQPLKVNGSKQEGQPDGETRSSGSSEDARRDNDKQRGSEDDVDRPLDPKVSRNGTLRNTDSFFKDENTETRKITLTPNLLRDDSSNSTTGSRERGPSLESLEKNGFGDKTKEDKKKKEKKSGMLSGLFKRKDKKSKGDSIDSDAERPEEADRSSPQSKPSEESLERPSGEQAGPVRQPSKGKLQKTIRTRDDSPQQTKSILKTDSAVETTTATQSPHDGSASKPTQQTPASMRLVSPDQDSAIRPSTADSASANNAGSRNPFSSAMKTQPSAEAKPEKVKQATQRIQLDDFDSDDESNDPFADPDAQSKAVQPQPTDATGRLSESPVHVTAADVQPLQKQASQERDQVPNSRQPPGLTTDSSSLETSSPVSTPTPDDSPMQTIPENTTLASFQQETGPSHSHHGATNSTTTIPPPTRPAPTPDSLSKRDPSPPVSSESSLLPAWSDASLRAYLDDGSDIRDMLVVVNDTTGVVPVGPDHPFMKDLFREESKRMQSLSGELDKLLTGLMEKRMVRNGSGASGRSIGGGGARSANGLRSTSRDGVRAGSRSR